VFSSGLLIGLTGTSSSPDENTLLGAVLALLGAVTVALYLIIGRSLRARLPLLPYVWMVYGFAAVFLLLVLLATGTPVLGYAPNAYVAIILLGLVPQLIGHSAFNYALGYLSATAVSLATQLEPIASAIVAFFVFRELPTNAQIVGAVIILVGVMMAILGQRPRQAEPAPAG
jgi:drug/metabolite transporter (DMT)-like permease